jgi:hypothetical protein
MKVKMALYKYSDGGSPFGMDEDTARFSPTSVRVSEFLDIEFPDRKREDIVPEQIAKIDKEMDEEKERFSHVMERLNRRKSEILAITDEREVA